MNAVEIFQATRTRSPADPAPIATLPHVSPPFPPL